MERTKGKQREEIVKRKSNKEVENQQNKKIIYKTANLK